jgi:hypothetical protein
VPKVIGWQHLETQDEEDVLLLLLQWLVCKLE